jgi:uncharacterized protein
MERVGRVTAAWRYPVKSMAGERLDSAPVTLQGVQGDRGYAFVQAGSKSPFPWLTGREMATLLQHRPTWVEGERPSLNVRTPGGEEWSIGSDELREHLERESGKQVFLLPNYRGSFDVAPVTLISAGTIGRIAEASGTDAEPGRFRMNFYIETESGEPFAEDAWVGRVLRIGETVRVGVTERDRRCLMITLHPQSAQSSPEVLKAAGELNEAYAGIYGAVLTPGEVREGDEIVLE